MAVTGEKMSTIKMKCFISKVRSHSSGENFHSRYLSRRLVTNALNVKLALAALMVDRLVN